MNTIVAPLVVILLIFLPQARTSVDIIGQWEGVEPAEGDAHIRLQFRRDRVVLSTFGIYTHGTYEVRGNDIIVKSTNSDSATDRERIRLEGDTLILGINDDEMRLERLRRSEPGDLPFVGEWGEKGGFFHGGNNGLLEVKLKRDGRITIKLEREPERERYKITGNLLTMGDQRYKVRFEGGLLILKPLDDPSKVEKYKRIGKD